MHLHARLFSTAAALALLATPALAVDPKAFADRLVAIYAMQGGVTLTYREALAEGDDIIIEGVAGTSAGNTLAVGDFRFTNVGEDGDDYTAERMDGPSFNYTAPDGEFSASVTGIEIDNIVLPPEDSDFPFMLYDRAAIDRVSVDIDGQNLMSMTDFITIVEGDDPKSEMSFDSQVGAFMFDTRAAKPDAKAVAMLEALDAVTIAGSMAMKGTWKAADGTMDLQQMRVDVPEKGALDIAVDFKGYTLAFIKSLQEVSKAAEAAGSDEKAQQAQGLAMLGLMQQLSFASAKFRYEDDGLAVPLMDYLATQQGMDRTTMINQTKGVLPFMLAQLQKPEFAASVTQAISTFLDDPQSLTVTANPPAPVAAPLLMATGMSAPQNLIEQLNVKVTAND